MQSAFGRFLQRDSFDCAVPLVQGVLLHLLRQRRSRKDILAALGTSRADGTHPHQLELFFRQQGLRVLAGEFALDDLRWQTRRGRPVLCLTTFAEGEGHWVGVLAVRRRRVHFHDPASGPRSLPEAEFLAAWRDYDKRGPYDRYGLAVHVGEVLTPA